MENSDSDDELEANADKAGGAGAEEAQEFSSDDSD